MIINKKTIELVESITIGEYEFRLINQYILEDDIYDGDSQLYFRHELPEGIKVSPILTIIENQNVFSLAHVNMQNIYDDKDETIGFNYLVELTITKKKFNEINSN